MSEAVTRGCSVKKVFLKVSQNSQKNTCVRLQATLGADKGADLRQLYSKRGFGTGAFLRILRNIYEHFFYRTHRMVTF